MRVMSMREQDVVDALARYYIDPTTIDPSLASIDALYAGLRNTATRLDLGLSAS
jgi:hypothetical protein